MIRGPFAERCTAPLVRLLVAVVAVALAPACAAAGGAADSAAVQPKASAHASSATPADSANLPPLFAPPDSALGAALRKGGYVIVFRHAITDWGERDAAIENFEDRSAQRNLSDAGRRQSEEIGKAIAAAGIPIGAVLASPMWRCRDTAQLAFGKHETSLELFRRGGPSRDARIRMMSTPPADGTNAVLVTHQDVLLPIVRGLRREQLREGEAFVVRPVGEGQFKIVAQAGLEHWTALAPKKP